MPNFGLTLKTNEDFLQEIYGLVEKSFPMSLCVVDGELINFSYEVEWKQGGTVPTEKSKTGEIEYIEDYKKVKLTKAEQKILNDWAVLNVKNG